MRKQTTPSAKAVTRARRYAAVSRRNGTAIMSAYGRAGPNFPRRGGAAGSVVAAARIIYRIACLTERAYAEQGSSDEMMISIAGGSKETSELCDAESISWKAAGEEAGNDLETVTGRPRRRDQSPFRRRGRPK